MDNSLKEIEIAIIENIKELGELLYQLFSNELEFIPDRQKQEKGLKEIINDPDIGEILILKFDKKIVGMVSLLYSVSTALGGKVAILEDMIIDKNHRKKGYGSYLLNEAIVFAKKRNCLRITLLTDYNNEIAIKFYNKSGFVNSPMIPLRLVFK